MCKIYNEYLNVFVFLDENMYAYIMVFLFLILWLSVSFISLKIISQKGCDCIHFERI